jgi:hypothetical protein
MQHLDFAIINVAANYLVTISIGARFVAQTTQEL